MIAKAEQEGEEKIRHCLCLKEEQMRGKLPDFSQ